MNKICITLVLLTLTTPSFAVDNLNLNENIQVDNPNSEGNKHIVGVNIGIGRASTDISSEISDSENVGGLFYGYQFNSTWTLNTGVIVGDSLCIFTCSNNNDRTLDFNSYFLSVKSSYSLNNRWSVFGKLGVNHYNYEFSGDDRVSLTENGFGSLLATGFDFRARSGFGIGLEVLFLDMGNVSQESFGVNFSYMF